MGRQPTRPRQEPAPRRRPATTPEGREMQLAAQAYDLAERQIQDGTASAQVLVHFIKYGSTRERLEQQRIAHENELLQAKREAMDDAKMSVALYQEAHNALRKYQGQEPVEYENQYDE